MKIPYAPAHPLRRKGMGHCPHIEASPKRKLGAKERPVCSIFYSALDDQFTLGF